MKKYLLLRDNNQSGPYSFDDITSLPLKPLDLVWVEAESTAWSYPSEIEELKNFVCEQEVISQKERTVFVSLPSNFSMKRKQGSDEENLFYPVNKTEPVLETNYSVSLNELKENFAARYQNKPIWSKRIFQPSGASGLAAVLVGVVMGAFVIKKMVDGAVPTPAEESVAIPVIDREPPPPDHSENYKNAIVTEVVPVVKSEPKKAKKTGDIRKQILVKNNQYKVGLFGGINGLQLTIFNTSPHFVDKIIVAVDYLRPNGDVVQSENVVFSSIKSKAAQTIPIPGSNRGVKVKYKILKVYSHDYQAAAREI